MVLVVVMAGGTCLAQADGSAAEDFKPLNQSTGASVSPVNSRVVFGHALMPRAHTVLLDIGGARYPMTQYEDAPDRRSGRRMRVQ